MYGNAMRYHALAEGLFDNLGNPIDLPVGIMLAHYTTPTSFASMLKSGEFWFSNSRTMNDTSELGAAFNEIHAAIMDHAERLFPERQDVYTALWDAVQRNVTPLRRDSYIFSMSIHDPAQAPAGRLAMWRAYGLDGNGLCVVFKPAPLTRNDAPLFPISAAKMRYEPQLALRERLLSQIDLIQDVFQRLKVNEGEQDAVNLASISLAIIALNHKSAHFSDEMELRLYHLQSLHPSLTGDMRIEAEVVRGTLRPVFKLPIRPYPEFKIENTTFDSIIDHVVIGPSLHQDIQQQAVEVLLKQHNVNAPVTLSDIPYRAT